MNFFIGAVIVSVILFALYKYSPYSKRKLDEFRDKVVDATDRDGDGKPFR